MTDYRSWLSQALPWRDCCDYDFERLALQLCHSSSTSRSTCSFRSPARRRSLWRCLAGEGMMTNYSKLFPPQDSLSWSRRKLCCFVWTRACWSDRFLKAHGGRPLWEFLVPLCFSFDWRGPRAGRPYSRTLRCSVRRPIGGTYSGTWSRCYSFSCLSEGLTAPWYPWACHGASVHVPLRNSQTGLLTCWHSHILPSIRCFSIQFIHLLPPSQWHCLGYLHRQDRPTCSFQSSVIETQWHAGRHLYGFAKGGTRLNFERHSMTARSSSDYVGGGVQPCPCCAPESVSRTIFWSMSLHFDLHLRWSWSLERWSHDHWHLAALKRPWSPLPVATCSHCSLFQPSLFVFFD